MTTVDVLRLAQSYIEEGWTRGWFARDASGGMVGSDSPAACRWCITGALNRASADLNCSPMPATRALKGTLGIRGPLYAWNDALRDKRAVLRVLDRAIDELGVEA